MSNSPEQPEHLKDCIQRNLDTSCICSLLKEYETRVRADERANVYAEEASGDGWMTARAVREYVDKILKEAVLYKPADESSYKASEHRADCPSRSGLGFCACEALNNAEARILAEQLTGHEIAYESGKEKGFWEGFSSGVSHAREVVDAKKSPQRDVEWNAALETVSEDLKL